MALNHYSNFDLLIESTQDGYRARVIESPVGQLAPIDFQLPATIASTTDQLRLVGGAIRAFHRIPAPDQPDLTPLNPETFGQELFATIFHDDLRAHLQRSLDRVRDQNNGLRIRLHLDEAPELALLPWEYMFNPFALDFFVLSERTPIVRYPALAQPETPLTVALPLHILAIIANPQDVGQPLDIAGERAKLEEALQGLVEKGGVKVTWFEQATQAQLQQALRQDEYHIFHFIGHGWFDEVKEEGGLLFVNEAGAGQAMSARMLGTWLHDHEPLRLAFLNACEGARTAEGQPFGGVAQTLVQRGLPAVIAMQFPITDDAAIALAKEFYSALADGAPVDAALAEARKAIYGLSSVMEWGTPVLFMRADDGHLFGLAKESSIVTQSESTQQDIHQEKNSQQPGEMDHSTPKRSLSKKARALGLIALGVFAIIALSTIISFYPSPPNPGSTVPTEPSGESSPAGATQPTTVTNAATTFTATTVITDAVYIHILPGTLTMGITDTQLTDVVNRCKTVKPKWNEENCRSWYEREQPTHTVAIDEFWIMDKEVSNAQYRKCVDARKCAEPGDLNKNWNADDGGNYPVSAVSWYQARAYAEWVGGALPTEAEWEMACRGTEDRMYPWAKIDVKTDENELLNYANYAWLGTPAADLATVSSGEPSDNGLYNMAGNVAEWTRSIWQDTYHQQLTESGQAAVQLDNENGDPGTRKVVVRGGSLAQDILDIRCTSRIGDNPKIQIGGYGFRVVLHHKP